MFNKRNSRPLRPITIDESDDDTAYSRNDTAPISGSQSSNTDNIALVSPKTPKRGRLKPKKLIASSASRKKSSMRASFQDEIDDEDILEPAIQLKKSNLSKSAFSRRKQALTSLYETKTVPENTIKSDLSSKDYYNSKYLKILEQESKAPEIVTSNQMADLQPSLPNYSETQVDNQDTMLLALSDDELITANIENDLQEQELKESILNNEFDAEEGIGFDDELLPVTKKEQQLYNERLQFERAEAFIEAQEEEEANEEEDFSQENRDWEYDQLKKGVISRKNFNLSSLNHNSVNADGTELVTDIDISIPQLQQIPDLSQLVSALNQKLELMKIKKLNLERQLEDLSQEVLLLSQKEVEVKKNISSATEKFENLQVNEGQKNSPKSNGVITST